MKFKTNYNLNQFPAPIGEVNLGVSLTIPDQVMTTREIMERYARGLPLNTVKIPIYDEEIDYDNPLASVDFNHLDLAEREQIIKRLAQERDEHKARYNRAVEDAKKLKNEQKVLETSPTYAEVEYEAQEGQYPDPKAKLPSEGQKAKKRQQNDARH